MGNDMTDLLRKSALFRFNESAERIEKCLSILSEEQILSRPNGVSNSIANILIHLNGNITQYIMSGLAGKPDHRIRDLEFEAISSINKEVLQSLMKETFMQASDVILHLDEAQWKATYLLQGFEMSGVDAVLHVVEHASYHTGQITYITKMLTNQHTNYYEGIDLNVHNA
ncbi:MAG: DUF1572 family protein [Saprospiraceae bacterium]|nr:DUF1572 family protein [Saprospiraceae bacterium]